MTICSHNYLHLIADLSSITKANRLSQLIVHVKRHRKYYTSVILPKSGPAYFPVILNSQIPLIFASEHYQYGHTRQPTSKLNRVPCSAKVCATVYLFWKVFYYWHRLCRRSKTKQNTGEKTEVMNISFTVIVMAKWFTYNTLS